MDSNRGCFIYGFQMFPSSSSQQGATPVAYSQFINDINDNKISEVNLSGQYVVGKTREGKKKNFLPMFLKFKP